MMYVLAAVALPVLWVAAVIAHRRVGVSRVWVIVDVVVGVIVGMILASDGRVVEGVLLGLAVTPVLILFSALRTVQLRYIERKTQAILDSSPGMRDAYERRSVPSRRQRKRGRDGR